MMMKNRKSRNRRMGDFLRSSTILLMGLTVMGAGVFVVFYG
jgi:hypothetical protein